MILQPFFDFFIYDNQKQSKMIWFHHLFETNLIYHISKINNSFQLQKIVHDLYVYIIKVIIAYSNFIILYPQCSAQILFYRVYYPSPKTTYPSCFLSVKYSSNNSKILKLTKKQYFCAINNKLKEHLNIKKIYSFFYDPSH